MTTNLAIDFGSSAFDEWVHHRVKEFSSYTLPSMNYQVEPPDLWLIYIAKEKSDVIINSLSPHLPSYAKIVPVTQTTKDRECLATYIIPKLTCKILNSYIKDSTSVSPKNILSLRLDSDDILHKDYIVYDDGL